MGSNLWRPLRSVAGSMSLRHREKHIYIYTHIYTYMHRHIDRSSYGISDYPAGMSEQLLARLRFAFSVPPGVSGAVPDSPRVLARILRDFLGAPRIFFRGRL